MRSFLLKGSFLAVLLAVVVLGAQLHLCTDLVTAPSASHFCPVCSTTGNAIEAHSLCIPFVAVEKPLESFTILTGVLSVLPLAISPRAPPTL